MNTFQTMGVINVTPDSFSDGDLYNSQENFDRKFQESLALFDIVDIGAESTAPFNPAISAIEEKSRLQNFLSYVESHPEPKCHISLDTYKIDVFKETYIKIRSYWPSVKIIFNDVSGKLDDELTDLLNSKFDFTYVYSHNLCPDRSLTSEHMNYCFEGDGREFLQHINSYFEESKKFFKKIEQKVIYDPCFGFSKTRYQNHHLLKNLHQIEAFYNEKLLVGISRKSFMRFPAELNPKDEKNINLMNHLQTLIFQQLRSSCRSDLFFRVHDLDSIIALKNFDDITI